MTQSSFIQLKYYFFVCPNIEIEPARHEAHTAVSYQKCSALLRAQTAALSHTPLSVGLGARLLTLKYHFSVPWSLLDLSAQRPTGALFPVFPSQAQLLLPSPVGWSKTIEKKSLISISQVLVAG